MKLKVKADENIPAELAVFLTGKGHDASTVYGLGLSGCPDVKLASVCTGEKRAAVIRILYSPTGHSPFGWPDQDR